MPVISRHLNALIVAIPFLASLAIATPPVSHPSDTPPATLPEKHRATLEAHCNSCHNAEKQKGKFRVDDLPLSINDNHSAERWQKILNAINSGEMPPEEEKPRAHRKNRPPR